MERAKRVHMGVVSMHFAAAIAAAAMAFTPAMQDRVPISSLYMPGLRHVRIGGDGLVSAGRWSHRKKRRWRKQIKGAVTLRREVRHRASGKCARRRRHQRRAA